VPSNGVLNDLSIYTFIAAELILFCPILKVEEVAEELEGLKLVKQAQSKAASEMPLKQSRCLFKFCKHPRSVDVVFCRLALECVDLRRLHREAPMQVNAPERSSPLKERKAGAREYFRNLICVLGCAWQIEP